MTGPFQISSDTWPGLGKLLEECGELAQVIGKLIATGGETEHWDQRSPNGELLLPDLRIRIQSEIADVCAAIEFVIRHNNLDTIYRTFRSTTSSALSSERARRS